MPADAEGAVGALQAPVEEQREALPAAGADPLAQLAPAQVEAAPAPELFQGGGVGAGFVPPSVGGGAACEKVQLDLPEMFKTIIKYLQLKLETFQIFQT